MKGVKSGHDAKINEESGSASGARRKLEFDYANDTELSREPCATAH